MRWAGLRVLSTQRGGVSEGTGWVLHPFPSGPTQGVHMSAFPPCLFSPRKETEACLGQTPSSFPVPSSKASEANWKDWELLGLFQRGTGGTWKNWDFLLLPRD